MATPAELLDNMVPVSAFSRGKAAQAFSSASNSTPVIVLKNNAPYRVITTPDEYAYLSEVEADMVLMAEAMARLTANQDAGSVPAEEVYAELGIALDDYCSAFATPFHAPLLQRSMADCHTLTI
ncbi:antitoxin PHD [Eggerthella lenta]|uniref:antitoxin PHD n=1 Tax=Eggerthella lenta TaxID=84112 RepID=UPI00215D878A|nr:antitoxin PHD [Eggerthella lenta]